MAGEFKIGRYQKARLRSQRSRPFVVPLVFIAPLTVFIFKTQRLSSHPPSFPQSLSQQPAAMARSLCSAVSPTSLSSVPLLLVRPSVRPRHTYALSFSASRPLVARCAAAGDKVEAETPIEKSFSAFPSVMDINQIREFLPHRYPFLMVDRVIDHKPGEYVVGVKNVSVNEEFFQGHLPGRPIMPGVLIVEALAQVGGILIFQPEVGGSQDNVFFAGFDKVRFRKPVVPGDTLIMRVTLTKLQKRFRIVKMDAKAYVGSDLVCEAELLITM